MEALPEGTKVRYTLVYVRYYHFRGKLVESKIYDGQCKNNSG